MKNLLTILFLCCCNVIFAQNYRIGDVYTAPDGSRGIVYYLHPDGSGGWVVALNDASTGCAWGDASDVPGLANQSPSYIQQLLNDTAGYTNTQTLRLYQNNDNYAAGVVDFDNGWVLPSPAQLSMLFGQLPFIASAITAAGGTEPDSTSGLYWCSAERNNTKAYTLSFGVNTFSGYLNGTNKTDFCHVRAVRSFSFYENIDASYLWNTGDTTPGITVTPTQTTTYTVTVSTSGGCADTVEQTIVVNSVTSETFYDAVCQDEPYIGNGFSLSEDETSTPGMIVRTRTEDVNGCPATYTLELTVNTVPHTYVEQFACGSYEWNGQTYTQSGDYTVAYPTIGGCDSVVTLHLTIGPTPEVVITTIDTICVGNEVTLQAQILNSNALLPKFPVAIGDILCTDNSIVKPTDWPVVGKTAKGVVFYVDNTGEHGWAMHLQDQTTSVKWGDSQIDIPDVTTVTLDDITNDMEGYSNTQSIRATGAAQSYPAAWAVDFENGWYLPAAGQLSHMVYLIMFVNPTLILVEGQPLPIDGSFKYWSSTETGANFAVQIDHSNKAWGYNKQTGGARVRSICSF